MDWCLTSCSGLHWEQIAEQSSDPVYRAVLRQVTPKPAKHYQRNHSGYRCLILHLVCHALSSIKYIIIWTPRQRFKFLVLNMSVSLILLRVVRAKASACRLLKAVAISPHLLPPIISKHPYYITSSSEYTTLIFNPTIFNKSKQQHKVQQCRHHRQQKHQHYC